MSKKNKPITIRLGIHTIKNYINQNYGKTYNIYIYNFFYQQYFFSYIINYFEKHWNYINYIEIFWLKKKIFFNLHYTNIINYVLFIKTINVIFKNKIQIRLYKKNFSNITTLLLSSYSNYLLKKNINHKKKILILVHILNKTVKTSKWVYTKRGPVKLVMLGYKIKLSGRVENTKNQMAKNITYKFGKMSLVTLNNQLDFISKTVFTKLGTYSLSIWLYYKSV